MSAKAMTKLLQQKYNTLNGQPFNILDVTVNVPGDELLNDVTVYLDKESATTVEWLDEDALLVFGHQLLEEAFIQMAAPARCSLHLSYQFFDAAVSEYERDETYYIGDWWDGELGYWVTRTYLNLYYDEQAEQILSCDTWFNSWRRSYRPERSKLLAFADDETFAAFWNEVLQAPKYATLSILAIDIYQMAHGYKVCQIEIPPREAAQLKKSEYLALVLGCRFFTYALRYYQNRLRKVRVKITTAEEEIVSFEKRGPQDYWYQSWLDQESVRLQLSTPLVFNGRAKRALVKYLTKQFTFRVLRITVLTVKVFEEKALQTSIMVEVKTNITTKVTDRLMSTAEKCVWDIYEYYGQPKGCRLKIQDRTLGWYVMVQLRQMEDGYRLIRQSSGKSYETVFVPQESFLNRLSDLFQRNWQQYRYEYRPTKLIEK